MGNCFISWITIGDTERISEILETLEIDKSYLFSFDFIHDANGFVIGDPSIVLSKPILISKESNPELISNFLIENPNSVFLRIVQGISLFYIVLIIFLNLNWLF